uniref:Uncharacterized protein n=1 Tax=Arundo donax TaxID=35708 RepID=A0A0A9FF55_ARUDO
MSVHDCARSPFSIVVITEVCNGANTKFWTNQWLNGLSIKVLAPHLFACVTKQRANKRTVQEALEDSRWLQDIQGHYSVDIR